MTVQHRILAAFKEKLTGRKVDVVEFVDELLTATRDAGEIRCTLARDGVLRIEVGTQESAEVELDGAKTKLRMLCARLGVLCKESGELAGSLYGGEGRIREMETVGSLREAARNSSPHPDWHSRSVSPSAGRGCWTVCFMNTPSEQRFALRAI